MPTSVKALRLPRCLSDSLPTHKSAICRCTMHGAAATPPELSARERARGSMRTSALNGSSARLGRLLLSRTLLRLLREVFLAFFVRRLVRRPGFLLRVNFSLPLCCAFLSCSFSFLCSLLCRPAGRRAEVASPPKRTVRSPRSILGRGHRVAVRSERTCRHKCECTREQCSDRPVHAVTPKRRIAKCRPMTRKPYAVAIGRSRWLSMSAAIVSILALL
jgi:hypothetical protein